jgi:hypothetical protein
MNRKLWTVMALGLASAFALETQPALACPRHARHNALAPSCDQACLEGNAHRYLTALLRHDPSLVSFGPCVKFTENNVSLSIGDGLWGTITAEGPPDTDLMFADPLAGEVGFFGVVNEHGVPGFYAMRLKIVHQRIAEVETLVNRVPPRQPGTAPSPFATKGPNELRHFPEMLRVEPASERVSRGRLIDIANGYFSTLQQNDGTLFAPFDPACSRMENGNTSAGDPSGSYPAAKLPCGEQFKRGNYRFDSGVRDRAFLVVDETRQLVLARAFLDHDATLTHYELPDGRRIASPFQTPSTLCMLELFKIRSGKIFRVEVVYIGVPYHMPSAWRSTE